MFEAFAKVNLSLQVGPPDATGLHRVRSLAQSVDWADRVEVETGAGNEMVVSGDPEAPGDERNLAWRAAAAVRNAARRSDPMRVTVHKRIPVASGLGGGSADAAAALAAAARVFAVTDAVRDSLAAGIGADVPFCLRGGTAWMEGRGERIAPAGTRSGFALAVVVPPFRLAAAVVYRRWDALQGPEGPEIPSGALPTGLRDDGPLRNDLFPAAVSLAPELGDWTADLARRWSSPVAMSGSGPALFGYFPTGDEAAEAVAAVAGARAGRSCLPVDRGWRENPPGTLR